MIGVDHSGPENAEQNYEDCELVQSPQHIASDVGHPLLYLNVMVTLFLKIEINFFFFYGLNCFILSVVPYKLK